MKDIERFVVAAAGAPIDWHTCPCERPLDSIARAGRVASSWSRSRPCLPASRRNLDRNNIRQCHRVTRGNGKHAIAPSGTGCDAPQHESRLRWPGPRSIEHRRSHPRTSRRCRHRFKTRCAARLVSLQRQPMLHLLARRSMQEQRDETQKSTVIGDDPARPEPAIQSEETIMDRRRGRLDGLLSVVLLSMAACTPNGTPTAGTTAAVAPSPVPPSADAPSPVPTTTVVPSPQPATTALPSPASTPVNVQPATEQAAPQGLRPDAPPYGVHGPHAVGTRDVVVTEGDHTLALTIWYPALNPTNAQGGDQLPDR